jgi:transcriptional regulator with XRE-family HTH domain
MTPNKLKKQLGLRLKELRLERNLKQEQIEEKFGFSYRYLGRLERGAVNPTLETLLKLCKIYKVSMSDLFMFSDVKSKSPEDSEAIAAKIAGILSTGSKAKLKKLRTFLEDVF